MNQNFPKTFKFPEALKLPQDYYSKCNQTVSPAPNKYFTETFNFPPIYGQPPASGTNILWI